MTTDDKYLGTKLLLESKRPPIAEIEITLFEYCNIVCTFCGHEKNSKVGFSAEELASKLPIVYKFLDDRKNTVEHIQLNMVGGELFQEDILDEWLPLYLGFAWKVQEYAEALGYNELRIVWVSNFLFKSHQKVADFIDSQRATGIVASMICSYDNYGRPMNKAYWANIEALKDRISTINMVATVGSIRALMAGDERFDRLYAEFDIFIDDYIPDRGKDADMPSDSMLLEYYRFMAVKYPNVITIRELLSDEPKPMHCLSLNKLTIFPDNSTANCLWDRYGQEDFVSEFDRKDNAGKMQTHMDTYGCLSCEFFDRCGLRCFVQSDWRNRVRDLPDCVLRMFYRGEAPAKPAKRFIPIAPV